MARLVVGAGFTDNLSLHTDNLTQPALLGKMENIVIQTFNKSGIKWNTIQESKS